MFCNDFIIIRPPFNGDTLASLFLLLVGEAFRQESWLFLTALNVVGELVEILTFCCRIFPLDEEGFNWLLELLECWLLNPVSRLSDGLPEIIYRLQQKKEFGAFTKTYLLTNELPQPCSYF